MSSLFSRVRERKLFQWAVAYLAAGWVFLQVLDLVGDKFGWPDTVGRIAIVLLAFGFLAVVVLAWFHGEKGHQRAGVLELGLLTGIVLLGGAAVLLVRNAEVTPGNDGLAPLAADDETAGSIAVLPFTTFTEDAESNAFASGIQEEILTQLTNISALKVISRTSVQQYAGTRKLIRQIAKELGVATVLEGSVQRAGSQVRVQAKLIEPRTDRTLWAQQYNGDFSQVFQFQSDIAQKIAGALAAKLTVVERARITAKPTENSEAYDMYLQGRQYMRRSGYTRQNTERGQQLMERAVALDPNFALAHAGLSVAHSSIRWFAFDVSPARLELARKSAETALRLQPGLPEAHYAMGVYHYFGHRDYARALAEFEIARQSMPGEAEVLATIAAVKRRQGKFEEAAAGMAQVAALDPRNVRVWSELGDTYTLLHRYREAESTYRKALDIAPDELAALVRLGWSYVYLLGRTDSLGAALERATSHGMQQTPGGFPDVINYNLVRRDGDRLLAFVEGGKEEGEDYLMYFVPRSLAQAWAYRLKGDTAAARAAFESARPLTERHARAQPQDPRYQIALGHIYAGLGRRAEAVAAARRAMESMPASRDAFYAPIFQQQAAQVMADAGDANAAIALLQTLLTSPSLVHPVMLRLYPSFDPIRSDPRFQALVKGR